MRRNIARDHGAGSNDGSVANADAAEYEASRTDPAAIADSDGLCSSGASATVSGPNEVTAGDELDTRRNVAPIADPDVRLGMGVDDHARAQPRLCSYAESSTAVDPATAAEAGVALDLNPRKAQQAQPQSEEAGWRQWPEQQIDEVSQHGSMFGMPYVRRCTAESRCHPVEPTCKEDAVGFLCTEPEKATSRINSE